MYVLTITIVNHFGAKINLLDQFCAKYCLQNSTKDDSEIK